MMNKKIYFLMMLLIFLFPTLTACMKMIELKRGPTLQSKVDVEQIKNEIRERNKSYIITGCSSAASRFFYSVLIAKNKNDLDNALMAKGEFFIPLYRKEQIQGCSALGIVMMANDVPTAEKKEFIQKLIVQHQFKPTPEDKEIDSFEKESLL